VSRQEKSCRVTVERCEPTEVTDSAKFPDFYLVGAPKCGTTALYNVLSKHPQVFLPYEKEPHFFLPRTAKAYWPRCTRIEDYLRLFEGASRGQTKGEMSVTYLYYAESVRRILHVRPDAKFIVVVRNPSAMAYSLHNQLYRVLAEDVADFEEAWRLQSMRRFGKRIPHGCIAPEWLQYRDVCSVGSQLERLFGIVRRSQVHVIVYDDLRLRPRLVYVRLVKFLGIEDDGRREFPVVNPNQVLRSRALARILLGIRSALGSWYFPARHLFVKCFGLRPIQWLWRANLRPEPRRPLRREFGREMAAGFRDEVFKLERLLGRGFPAWLEPISGCGAVCPNGEGVAPPQGEFRAGMA